MTFEEFFKQCTFDTHYINFGSKGILLVMVFFVLPSGEYWVRDVSVDTEKFVGPKANKEYAAKILYLELKAKQVI